MALAEHTRVRVDLETTLEDALGGNSVALRPGLDGRDLGGMAPLVAGLDAAPVRLALVVILLVAADEAVAHGEGDEGLEYEKRGGSREELDLEWWIGRRRVGVGRRGWEMKGFIYPSR